MEARTNGAQRNVELRGDVGVLQAADVAWDDRRDELWMGALDLLQRAGTQRSDTEGVDFDAEASWRPGNGGQRVAEHLVIGGP